MIVLDTHIWYWWVQGNPRLLARHRDYLTENESMGLGISAISCWEIAMLVRANRLLLPIPVEDWIGGALSYPGMELLPLTPAIAVDSARLPGSFHRDPADQMIVATARAHRAPLVSFDAKIREYPFVLKGP